MGARWGRVPCWGGRERANGEKGFPASREENPLQEFRGDGGRGACEGGGPLGQGLLPFVGVLGEEGVSLPAEEGPALERWRGTGGLRRSLRAGITESGAGGSKRGAWGGGERQDT